MFHLVNKNILLSQKVKKVKNNCTEVTIRVELVCKREETKEIEDEKENSRFTTGTEYVNRFGTGTSLY